MLSLFGVAYRSDCREVVDTVVTRGAIWATSAERVLARLWFLFFAAFDGAGEENQPDLVWMPAHCPATSVGVARLSNGHFLTEVDRIGNAHADRLAQQGAELHRVPAAVRKEISDREAAVRFFAARHGIVTSAANNCTACGSADAVARPESDGLPAARSRARRRQPSPCHSPSTTGASSSLDILAPRVDAAPRLSSEVLAQRVASLLAAAREPVEFDECVISPHDIPVIPSPEAPARSAAIRSACAPSRAHGRPHAVLRLIGRSSSGCV